MSTLDGPATAFTSKTVVHPVDRSGLRALETRVGEECAMASSVIDGGGLVVIVDPKEADLDRRMVILRAEGDGWVEEGRYTFWTDAYRVLGRLLDESIRQVPIDPIDRPSPTVVMAGEHFIEVMYRTAQGVRIARELDEGFDPRFEVYDLLWKTFAAATDDEAEYRG